MSEEVENTQADESKDEAVFAELFGSDEETTNTPEPQEEPEAVEQPTEEAVSSEGGDSGAGAGDPAGEADLEKAREFIKREKLIPQGVVDSMTPEQVIEAGNAARESIAEKTRQWQRLQELEAKEAQDAPEETSTDTVTPSGDSDWAQPFVEELGEELAGQLVDRFKAFETRENELREQLATLHAAHMDSLEKSARAEVGVRYPGVMDDETYATLGARMAALTKTGEYSPSDASRLIEDAAKLEGLELADPSRKTQSRKQRRNGLPTHNGKASPHTMSPKDLDDAIGRAILSGDDQLVASLTAHVKEGSMRR